MCVLQNLEATDSANTDMHDDHIERTVQPEYVAQLEAAASPGQPSDIPKPVAKQKAGLPGPRTHIRGHGRVV